MTLSSYSLPTGEGDWLVLSLADMKKFFQHKSPGQALGYNAIVERDAEGYFVASVLELADCHSQAKSMGTLEKRLREVIIVYLEALQGRLSRDSN